jgi:murein DD-endopeptidase MepM/ murein hydrolase activator NlpD
VLGPNRRASATCIAVAAVAALLVAASPALGGFGARALKFGDRGSSVQTLQTYLTTLGWSTPVDGRYGRRTKVNVKRWERANASTSAVKVDARVSRGEALLIAQQALAKSPGDGSTRSSDGSADAGGADTSTPTPAANSSGFVFPIQGAHDYGTAENRFGAPRGGRSHMGQDVLADCGLPVVAVEGGSVVYSGYQGAAGNYIVIKGVGTTRDYVYMHLKTPAYFQQDQTVQTGQRIGLVGETGDATACHLHFELWTPPGWYNGGEAVDPLPYLKEWDAAS